MYLKGVEIQGFKTFVDRVRLEFGPGVTAIVGPNGSGKSNIADAILWVLGEQSARTLRGARMDDVIFAGSEKRRPVGMAEVTLHLDNSDGSLPLEFEEIAVTRRFFRSGEGEYYINKVPCRLRDIQELFLDTGSGRGSLAIVGQGRLEEILSARPEERRAVLEEAAGIARYRWRKKEAEQRLEGVEQDLLRLHDLIGELKEQLGPAAAEAARARRYRKLSRLLNLVELLLKAGEMEETRRRHRRSQERLQALAAAMEELKALEQQLQAKAKELQEEQQRYQAERQRYQAELQSLREQLVRTRGEINLVREKLAELARQQEEDSTRQRHLEEEKASLAAALAALAREREENIQEQARLEQEIIKGREEQEKLQTGARELAAEIEKVRSNLFQVAHERAGCHNELVRLEEKQTAVERLLEQKRRQLQEWQKEREHLLDHLQAGQEQLQQLEEELKRLEGKKAGLEMEVQLKEAELAAREKELASWKERQRALAVQLKVLRQSQADYEGFAEGVKFILQARSRGEAACAGVLGVVVEKLAVPAELTRAVEVALGGAAQQILVRTAAEAEAVIQFLKARGRGRATILPLAWLEPRRWPAWANWVLKEPGVLGIAAGLVQCEAEVRPAVEYLLGQILIVADIRRALALGERLRPPVRLVTLEGEVIQPRGPVTGGVARQQGGYLQRRLAIQQGEAELANVVARIKKGQEQQEQLQKMLAGSRQEYHQVTEGILTCRGQIHNLLQRLSERKEDLARLEEKIAVLEEELVQSTSGSLDLGKERAEKQELLARLEALEGELNRQLSGLQERVAAGQQHLAVCRQELAVNEARLQALVNAREQLNLRERELARQQENWQRQQEELAARRAAAVAMENELKANLEKLAGEEDWLQGACQQAMAGLTRLEDETSTWVDKQEELAREQDRVQAQKDKLLARRQQEEINLARLETALAAGLAELEERFGPRWEVELQKQRPHLQRRAALVRERVKEKLLSLGEVNPGAMAAYGRLKARVDELEQQKQDLEGGRAALHQVINEMERLMARQLKATLAAVQEHFAAIFQELFDGGEARLELTGSEDILAAGLEIVARPPGKKPQHLALLSGGEKALTAVAFIFALLKVKPSAFCIFDEVDTALDEANVERFARLLRQFAARTQFIVISHRQGTMAAADVLYGVTMMEQGVSRLVSVRLEQLPA
ncbi:Structural maintenance of chromosomes protein [Moorella glycerini]|uniref:Chromosome partition protein Smc n=1 Tax=Neomoorella stamsii TaxID=1266720 RepID=A0A9X7P739_9FIRM|nr:MULTISPECIES: chromosome segregation protein SMC [Moorella]PRR76037.1 Chromosome partition protein Smc [Moorella stamsii]CEP68357.1 Structural maintenance of chromosomes protein [Moorella glycerini]